MQFLDEVVAWYRTRIAQQQLATDAADVVAMGDTRGPAEQVLHASFDFARAAAALLGAAGGGGPAAANGQPSQTSQYQQLSERQRLLDQQARALQSRIDAQRSRMAHLARAARSTAQSQVEALRAQLDLVHARRDAVHEFLQFLGSTASSTRGMGLAAQIDMLSNSLTTQMAASGSAAPAGGARGTSNTTTNGTRGATATAPSSGIWDLAARAASLSAKDSRIDDYIRQTDALAQPATGLRDRLLGVVRDDSAQADQLLGLAEAGKARLAEQRDQLDMLTTQFRMVTTAVVPLAKLSVLLRQYHAILVNWRDSVRREYGQTLRNLGIRAGVVAFILALIIAASEVWRRAARRYVHDVRRRYQLLVLRRFAIWAAVTIVLASTLASRLDSFVTFAGLITAGIAVAMQNVILSLVGYFFLIGRYGIRVGDRIQIGEVLGEVIDVGLIRMHLMEYSRGALAPTGRVVAFSNSVVFQASGAIFKQLPGVHFAWHEVTFTLPAAVDAAAVRERLLAAVDAALSSYKEEMKRQARELERAAIGGPGMTLSPSVRLRFASQGIEAAVRYPVDQRSAGEIDEAVSGELMRAVQREPRLQPSSAGVPELKLNTAPAG
jgi:small-conductance mechanosensitive channel